MIRQTDNPSELTVQNLLLWLQGKYDAQASQVRRGKRQKLSKDAKHKLINMPLFSVTTARQQLPSREYLPAAQTSNNNNVVGRPRPFQRPQTTARPVRPQGPYPQPSDQPSYEPYPKPGSTPKPEFSYPTRPAYT